MSTEFIGSFFSATWNYGKEEKNLVEHILQRVEQCFSNQNNLVINTTWFGPQFNNGKWDQLQQLIKQESKFDNLFLTIVIDPIYLSDEQIQEIKQSLQIKHVYVIGHDDTSPYYYNFELDLLAKSCSDLTEGDVKMTVPKHAFLCYQRKPRWHRIEFAEKIISKNLNHRGIITLGADDQAYQWGEGKTAKVMTLNEPQSLVNPPAGKNEFGGVTNDLESLGQLDIWCEHFLNVVSETEFNNWHKLFVSEKTWKPVFGMRPFVINGQTATYAFLRKHGFRTFNHYWNHIPIESGQDQIGDLVRVVEFICDQDQQTLINMYADMLDDLIYNRNRLLEFVQEQKLKIDHIFL